MKRQFLPYYISRILLSGIFSILVFGFTWKALVFTTLFFALFLLYLHSGWFRVDPTNPLFPICRDERGLEAQRKALIAALISGVGLFFILAAIPLPVIESIPAAPLAISLSVLVYFASQFILLAKA
jgi:hypothetical protein